MDTKRAAAAYRTLEKRVARVLVEHDGDVRAIISALQRATSVVDLRSILEDRLGSWIVDAGKDVDELCTKMAPAIWEAWSEFRSEAGLTTA